MSACFGGFDVVTRQTPQNVDVDWVLFTDDAGPPNPPWRKVVCPPASDPRMAAKWFKCHPPFTGDVIWLDASMTVITDRFAAEVLACRNDGVAAWQHPRRDCIYDEANAAAGIEGRGIYDVSALRAQADSYRPEYPDHGGLFACGTLALDMDDERVRRMGAMWFEECERWTPQDQVSFPVVCRRLGIEPGVFPVEQKMHNRWLVINEHRIVERGIATTRD